METKTRNERVRERVNEVLKVNEMAYAVSGIYVSNYGLEVTLDVEDGDWKHEHLCVEKAMEGNGFESINEDVWGEPDGDCYSASHTFIISEGQLDKPVVNVWEK